MKKRFFIIFLAFAVAASAEIVLMDWHADDPSQVHDIEMGEEAVIYEFVVSDDAFVLVTWNTRLSLNGNGNISVWLQIDGEDLPWTEQRFKYNPSYGTYGSLYSAGAYQLYFEPESGEHSIQLMVGRSTVSGGYLGAFLQVRYDIPESNAVCEQPDNGSESMPNRSILSAQPYVMLPGVQGVYTITGQRVDVVSGDRVELSRLSAGTYMAQTSTGPVKITKIQ